MNEYTKNVPNTSNWKGKIVVRGDEILGGLKRYPLERVLANIEQDVIVYPGDGYGSATEALAYACQTVGKKLKIFFPQIEKESNTFKRTIKQKNVSYEMHHTEVNFKERQLAVAKIGSKWAAENEAYFMPIGCRIPDFNEQFSKFLKEIIKVRGIDENAEMWYTAGSGTFGQALFKAIPGANLCIANLKFPQLNFGKNKVRVFNISEGLLQKPAQKSPFPTSEYYDSKMWRIIEKEASDNAVIWNFSQ